MISKSFLKVMKVKFIFLILNLTRKNNP